MTTILRPMTMLWLVFSRNISHLLLIRLLHESGCGGPPTASSQSGKIILKIFHIFTTILILNTQFKLSKSKNNHVRMLVHLWQKYQIIYECQFLWMSVGFTKPLRDDNYSSQASQAFNSVGTHELVHLFDKYTLLSLLEMFQHALVA